MSITLTALQISLLTSCALLGIGSVVPASALAESPKAEPITIRFDRMSPKTGLTLSITTVGDPDGTTTFANEKCCGMDDAQQFARDVRIRASGRALRVAHDASGWTVTHRPKETLTISYRLPPSGPMRIDGGMNTQMPPLVNKDLFHIIGTTAFLLPVGRSDADIVELEIDASKVEKEGSFVSSFGPHVHERGVLVSRSEAVSALYLGGPIILGLYHTPGATLGVVYSGMAKEVRGDDLRRDALAIVTMERNFFGNGQPWYLVSVHGGIRDNPEIFLGGGTGLTNSFAMFVTDALDFSRIEQREQFRWVLAHEYFHQWNGLTLRVASKPMSDDDDASIYWFSEGVTEFYAMRLLTRAGLQLPARSLDILNNKLSRYAANSKHGIGADEAGTLFWTDPDGEQIPYLRGYLAAWYADIALSRDSEGQLGLDSALQALVQRAKVDPQFRVNNAFLVAHLSAGMSEADAQTFQKFVIDGGDAPLDTTSFSPCLMGKIESISGHTALQFGFADPAATSCFQH